MLINLLAELTSFKQKFFSKFIFLTIKNSVKRIIVVLHNAEKEKSLRSSFNSL